MKISYLLSRELARKMILVHPPEPRKELLLSQPAQGIYIGKTRFLGTPVFWDFKKLINPHVAVVGITGSGKSYFVKSFLTRASLLWNSNAIIMDWVGEYNKWVAQAGGKVINLGKEKLNLLDLIGLPKNDRIKQIISALDILLDLKNYPIERDEIEEALEEVYDISFNAKKIAKKKNKKTKRKVQTKTFKSATLIDVVKILQHKKRTRAARLLKRFTVGGTDFFAGKSSIDLRDLTKSGLVCIDLHDLPTEEIRSLAGLTILQYIKEIMRHEGIREEKGIQLFVVLDEAWKISSDERSDVITIVREGRKYNFSLIIATQNPTDMHKTIFSNIGSMFVMRLILKEYRDYVRNSIGYSNFVDSEIARFGVGDAAVNMIFAERQGKSTTFLLNRIDGEEPLFLFRMRIAKGNGGEHMEIEIERGQFVKMLYEVGLSEGQVNIVKLEFEKSDGLLDAEEIVALLEKFGYSKPSILSFLRQLGVDERNLIHIFSLVKIRKATKGVVNLTLEA